MFAQTRMHTETLKDYFDRLADCWDERVVHDGSKIRRLFSLFEIPPNARILDVGSGTGVLIPIFLKRLGRAGRIIALDFSERMLQIAREKFGNRGIKYVCEDVENYEPGEEFDVISCYSCFPHFRKQKRLLMRMAGWLRAEGWLVVMHLQGRDQINSRHREADDAVQKDYLPLAGVVAAWMWEAGLSPVLTVDTQELYFVGGKKICASVKHFCQSTCIYR
ncbi:MAG TPA: class I SAM-dependent methyltransferase [Atribacteraceae bacterium]|nr:class I SAM-dependent methyltransferase [Atribacteraceae bacterium]